MHVDGCAYDALCQVPYSEQNIALLVHRRRRRLRLRSQQVSRKLQSIIFPTARVRETCSNNTQDHTIYSCPTKACDAHAERERNALYMLISVIRPRYVFRWCVSTCPFRFLVFPKNRFRRGGKCAACVNAACACCWPGLREIFVTQLPRGQKEQLRADAPTTTLFAVPAHFDNSQFYIVVVDAISRGFGYDECAGSFFVWTTSLTTLHDHHARHRDDMMIYSNAFVVFEALNILFCVCMYTHGE